MRIKILLSLLLICFSSFGQSKLAWLQSRPYSGEYQAVLDNASTSHISYPSASIRIAGNAFIQSLKNNGILAKLDVLKVIITDGPNRFSDINWVSPSLYPSTKYRCPIWNINGGITFRAYDTDNNYLDVGWAPTNGVQFTQNSAEEIIYYKNLPATFSAFLSDGTRSDNVGNNQAVFNPLSASTQVNAATNRSANTLVTDAQFDNTDGLYFFGRTSSSSEFVRKGSGSRVTTTSTSATPSIYNFWIGCLNEGANGHRALTQNTRTVGLYAAGSSLTTTDEDNFKTAWDTYMAVINAQTPQATLGTLYNQTTFSSLTPDFTVNGITAAISSGAINITGGASNFNQTLDLATIGSTKIAKWSQTITFKVVSTGNGIGLGVRSNNTSSRIDALVQFVTSSGVCNVLVGSGHSVGVSTTALTLSLNDVISLTVSLNEDVFSVDAYNVTTGSAHKTASYTYPATGTILPNTGTFSIFQFSGNPQVQSWNVSSTEYFHPKLAIIGDSKDARYSATLYHQGFACIIQDHYGTTAVLGGGSDRSAEYLSRVADVTTRIQPTAVLIEGISNDIRTGVASGTWQSNISSLVTACQSAGIDVYISTGIYESVLSQAAFRTWVNSTYPSAKVLDYVNNVVTLNVDNVHPDDAGHTTHATDILAGGKLP